MKKHLQKSTTFFLVSSQRYKDFRHILQNPKVPKNLMGSNNHIFTWLYHTHFYSTTFYKLNLFCQHSDKRMSWNGPEKISEYIGMAHNLPNKYLNIFGCHLFTKLISKYICTPELERIQIEILFDGHFIQIFEYSY